MSCVYIYNLILIMRKTTKLFLLFFVFLSFQAYARNIYLNVTFNDTNGNGDINNPYSNFKKAISNLSDQDIIIINNIDSNPVPIIDLHLFERKALTIK